LSEEEPREIEEDAPEEGEIVMPSSNQMNDLKMWVHANPNILRNCRTSHAEPEEPEDAPEDYDIDVEKKKIEAADPYEQRLKPISEDAKVKLSASVRSHAWVVKICGDASEYAKEENPKQVECNAVVVVRSLHWPGAYTFYFKERVLQVYMGNGHKHELKSNYFPLQPPSVLNDPEEYLDGPEPTPLEEPVAEAEDEEGSKKEESE